jgi:hypothetical protein
LFFVRPPCLVPEPEKAGSEILDDDFGLMRFDVGQTMSVSFSEVKTAR